VYNYLIRQWFGDSTKQVCDYAEEGRTPCVVWTNLIYSRTIVYINSCLL